MSLVDKRYIRIKNTTCTEEVDDWLSDIGMEYMKDWRYGASGIYVTPELELILKVKYPALEYKIRATYKGKEDYAGFIEVEEE